LSSEKALRASAEGARSESSKRIAELEKIIADAGCRAASPTVPSEVVPVAGSAGIDSAPVSRWLGVRPLSHDLARGKGNPPAGFTRQLIGEAKTVVVVKTKDGVVCGGFHFPAWLPSDFSKDPTKACLVFGLVNPNLSVPARFRFVGPVDAAVGRRWDDFLGFLSSPCTSGLGLGRNGVWTRGNTNWEEVPGGVWKLVGPSATRPSEYVEVAEWEIYQT
jgi:hypothetical protein